jgi:hypothetical protein
VYKFLTGGSRKKHAVVADVTDMESFKQAARLRTIQWRRCVECSVLLTAAIHSNTSRDHSPQGTPYITVVFSSGGHLSMYICFLTYTAPLTVIPCRTFRKDPQTLHGYVTLAIMEKLFKKHGSPLPAQCLDVMRQGFSVDAITAAPVLKVCVAFREVWVADCCVLRCVLCCGVVLLLLR